MTSRLCPICNRPFGGEAETSRLRSFCSRRCADIDLGRWLKGTYAIPADELDDETETEPSGPGNETGIAPEEAGAIGRRPRVKH